MNFKPIGALWNKQGTKGNYLSGNIELNGHKLQISIFHNDKAEGKKPNYSISADDGAIAEFLAALGSVTIPKPTPPGAAYKTSDFAELEDDDDLGDLPDFMR